MVGGNAMDATLQIARELCSNGVQKQFLFLFLFLFLFSSYLMLHLAPAASSVFKTSFVSSYVFARKTHTHRVVFHDIGDGACDGEEQTTNVLGFSRT